ncbi:MAG: hypothetical protein IKN87_02690 [Bacilli bacterium]|nr:hypothetical protein [Bacilli bacterium]
MDNVLDFLKKHKKKVIAIVVVLVVFIIIFVAIKKVVNYLTPSSKQSVYGDRCDAVAKIPVKNDTKDAIKGVFKEYELVEFKKIDVKCRLIDIIINLKGDMPDETVEEMSKKLLEVIPKDIKDNYDIEFYITNSNKENETYPRIGTHHKVINGESNDFFVW